MKTLMSKLIAVGLLSLSMAAPMVAEARDGRDRDRGGHSYNGGGYDNGYESYHYRGRGGNYGRDGWDSRQYWNGFDARINHIRHRIENGYREGSLNYREYKFFMRKLDEAAWQKRKFERSGYGIDPNEARALDERLDRISREVRWEKHDDNYGGGYGRGRDRGRY